jgi:hypothetical protein
MLTTMQLTIIEGQNKSLIQIKILKEMNTSIIIGIVVLLAIVLLVFQHNQKHKKHKNALLGALNEYAQTQGCKITENEVLNQNVIGIDKDNKKLIFVNREKNIEKMIDLSTIRKCNMNEISRNAGSGNNIQKVIEKVEFTFISKDSKGNLNIEVYNLENGDFHPSGEIQFTAKWAEIINNSIR